MKIVFFGTPDYVLPILNSLHKANISGPGESPIAAVVTQGPKRAGRKQILSYSPVDSWAHKRKIPIFHSGKEFLEAEIKADFGVLAAYGEVIPSTVIKLFPHGILNIHPSILPKYRGASPVQAALAEGDRATGVTIIKIDERVDHGPIVSQFTEDILPRDSLGTLRERLFARAAEALTSLIKPYLKGKIKLREQNHGEATYTTLVEKGDGFIPPEYLGTALQGDSFKGEWKIPFIKDFSQKPSAGAIERFIRSLDPWPGAWTLLRLSASEGQAKRLKILKAHLDGEKLVLDEVQLEGKNPVSWKEFLAGYPKVAFA